MPDDPTEKAAEKYLSHCFQHVQDDWVLQNVLATNTFTPLPRDMSCMKPKKARTAADVLIDTTAALFIGMALGTFIMAVLGMALGFIAGFIK